MEDQRWTRRDWAMAGVFLFTCLSVSVGMITLSAGIIRLLITD